MSTCPVLVLDCHLLLIVYGIPVSAQLHQIKTNVYAVFVWIQVEKKITDLIVVFF